MSNNVFIAIKDKLPADAAIYVKDKLDALSPEKASQVSMLSFKNPMTGLILGLFLGTLGADRFYKGDILLGILKLISLGGLGIWALIDLFLVYKGIKKDNLQKVQMFL
ncbi:TM2 domain-containing protein [Gallibacterium trehalosifermentans]|uniref:TM2 domain-containing protein n=1 Tax=Gallibacterium trehalosifermentans TaxID=516935 RepID=A0ABV6H1K8_9PAST